jgi:hypothetical protein
MAVETAIVCADTFTSTMIAHVTGPETILLAAHLGATAAMMGLIWFVQLVHYPLFEAVGPDRFVAYEVAHQRRTSWVVGPLMGVEGTTALVIAAALRSKVGLALPLVGLVFLAAIHTSTVLLQVPAHGRLSTSYDREEVRRLVRTNWVRTIGWSLRVVVAVIMIVAAA